MRNYSGRNLIAVALLLILAFGAGIGPLDAGDLANPLPVPHDFGSLNTCAANSSGDARTTLSDRPDCVDYAVAGNSAPDRIALVVLVEDQVRLSFGLEGSLEGIADDVARLRDGPVVAIGLVSGNPPQTTGPEPKSVHLVSSRELQRLVAVMSAIKARHGFSGFHLVGIGAAADIAASIGLVREDVSCVVVSGSALSLRDRLAETGALFNPRELKAANDPLALVKSFRPRAGIRFISLNDPTDPDTSTIAQSAFAAQARQHGLPFTSVALPALTSSAQRANQTLKAAITCADGSIKTLNSPTATRIEPRVALPETPTPARTLPARPALSSLPDLDDPGSRDPVETDRPALNGPAPLSPAPAKPQPSPPIRVETREPVAPAPPSAISDPATFTRDELLSGKVIDAKGCASLPHAIWITSLGMPECIRYYYSDVGGISSRMLVFLNGDFTFRGLDGQPAVDPDYARLNPAELQRIADIRSADYGGPMIYLARPGTLGSSGQEILIRHSPREVALIEAAMAEIKRRHGILTFDLIGHSGGGLLVGALVADRTDIGCAISTSGVLATNIWSNQRLNAPIGSSFLFDPMDHVADIHAGPGFRYILLTDPLDKVVSAASTQVYFGALTAAGIPFLHVALSASDEAHHDLALHGFRAAIACAHGMSDSEIVSILTNTVVTNRHMSELSPLGDMPPPSGFDGNLIDGLRRSVLKGPGQTPLH